MPLDDLEQVASLALVRAAHRYEHHRGKPFGVYATPTIIGEIKHHFRDRLWDLRVPRRVQDLHVALHHHSEILTSRLGRSPTLHELAQAAGATCNDVLEALGASNAFTARSLDTSTTSEGPTLINLVTAPDDTSDQVDARLWVDDLLGRLDPREQAIVRLRYYENMSQLEISQRMGISQMHVSRLLARTLTNLRDDGRLELAALN